ncbi:nitroreductase family protein [Mycobacterium marseillense]|nr:nitroreductase family protein [Mycobacterium marseillense]MDM3975315.1 nitroreductase family protein [Mycobacterium marseillense]
MHRELHRADSLSVSMFLQTFLLPLTERGLGTCVQMLIAAFPGVIRETLSIPDRYETLCGIAIGHPVADMPTNKLITDRDPLDQNVRFVES